MHRIFILALGRISVHTFSNRSDDFWILKFANVFIKNVNKIVCRPSRNYLNILHEGCRKKTVERYAIHFLFFPKIFGECTNFDGILYNIEILCCFPIYVNKTCFG